MACDSKPFRQLGGLNLALGMLTVLLALFTPPEGVHAQSCWDCVPMEYTNPPCWIDSCTWAGGAGQLGCSQFGGCDDPETCELSGGGCEGGPPPPPGLDGRSIAGMNAKQVRLLLVEARPEVLARLSWFREGDAEYLKFSCNGVVIHAVYSPEEAARLRRRTSRIIL